MTVWEDILAKLTAELIIKIIEELGQGDINNVECELADRVKIKATEDMAGEGWKYGFLVVILGKIKYDAVIGNPVVQWTTSEDTRGYGKTIQAKDPSFDWSKGEKKGRKVIEYKKFMGSVEESIRTFMLQVVDELYLEALKEEYISCGGWRPFEMIKHLHIKISKVTNKDKVQLKKEVFITWEQPQVLSAYLKQIDKSQKQLLKWNVKVSYDNIVIHVIDQMYESDLFSEETIIKWEEL